MWFSRSGKRATFIVTPARKEILHQNPKWTCLFPGLTTKNPDRRFRPGSFRLNNGGFDCGLEPTPLVTTWPFTLSKQYPMKKLAYILTTLAFAFSCFGLWAMLNLLGNVSARSSQVLPAFTMLLVDWRTCLLLLPLPVAAYTVYALIRWNSGERETTTFLACSMSLLCLVSFPVLMATFLPCVVLMEQTWTK